MNLRGAAKYPIFYRREARVPRSCEHCLSRFIASTSTQRFCNLACSTQATANKRREGRSA